jgi:hypothetical protein
VTLVVPHLLLLFSRLNLDCSADFVEAFVSQSLKANCLIEERPAQALLNFPFHDDLREVGDCRRPLCDANVTNFDRIEHAHRDCISSLVGQMTPNPRADGFLCLPDVDRFPEVIVESVNSVLPAADALSIGVLRVQQSRDLSLAGNLRGFSGSESGAFYGFIKVMKKLREQGQAPRAVLVENVIGFLSSHDGKFFKIALQQLADLGYYLDAFVVDAKHFVPQSRPRLFIVGFERSLMPTKRYKPNLFDDEGLDSFRENLEPFEGALRPRRLLEK